ncbi:LysR family transcriptional regulator [Ruegeria pomeroyi]|uniref:Transcriptional regulator, LysR family n=2 Tax=Ruegeria pomeroyi TaxID=89184 RepID=Q5LQ40_RUEPO|nr:LysR substrate-binding domain-containing protein [Ruegeria pomeroyi]AAV95901.1 transcriptional regulator, LysR family [Ruegeria pomeroyi DSS-3]NVK98232.1 LysR family transcriptional regulator [Ruegeria pomeroyi]NVL03209.1 LysR family transcriptional regulator [Ruegeria pomeroyi]QWV09469.1 LysR family transcriptional regulator [Ruegeria pomeroyi]
MDTRLLEDALILLEEGNLTAAAARRNVTQPAFSRRIRSLEQWIGTDLLVRGANRVELSPALAKCEPQIRALLSQLQQVQGQLKDPEGGADVLHVVTQHSLSVSAIPELIRVANSAGTRWHVRLHTRNQDEAMSMFLRHEVDVLVGYDYRVLPLAPFDSSVTRYVWRRDAFVPVVGGALRHRLKDGNVLPPDTPRISYPKGSLFGQIVSHYNKDAALSLDGPVVVESTFSVGIAQLVLSGIGAAWVPHSLIHDQIISGEVVILSPGYGRIPMDIALYARTDNKRAILFRNALAAPGA